MEMIHDKVLVQSSVTMRRSTRRAQSLQLAARGHFNNAVKQPHALIYSTLMSHVSTLTLPEEEEEGLTPRVKHD